MSTGRPAGDQDGERLSAFTRFDEWFVAKTLSAHLGRLCEWHIHPNVITGLSLGVAAAIPVLHFRGLSWWVAGSLILRQLLDCLDGEVARRCRKTSRFGGLLDAIADTVFFLAVTILMVSFLVRRPENVLWVSGAAFGGLFLVHVSICKTSGVMDHSVKTYRTSSLYRRSFAFLVNDSLAFAVVGAVLYRLFVRSP